MPSCPLHHGEQLEPKRKGWFCEECGAIVLGYDSIPPPEGTEFVKHGPADTLSPTIKAHSLPCPAADAVTNATVSKGKPERLQRDDVTRWSIVEPAARSSRQTLRALQSTKLSSTIREGHNDGDAVLWACLARPRRGLLVIGPSGVGKTTLLARIVDRALGPETQEDHDDQGVDPRDAVIFLSGRLAYEGEKGIQATRRLCDAVMRCAGIQLGEFDSLHQWMAHLAQSEAKDPKPRRRLWLVFDGIDEANDSDALLEAIDAFLPSLETYGWVRLVVSMADRAYGAVAARGAEYTHGLCGAFVSERWWTWFEEPRSERVRPYLELKGLDETDASVLYHTRQEQMASRSCLVPLCDLAHNIRNLLNIPLYQHLFHEAFRGTKAPPPGLDEVGLVDAFLDALVEQVPGLDHTLSRLGKAMMRRRCASLPGELGRQWNAEWLSQRAERHLKTRTLSLLDPVSELASASGLMVPEGDTTEDREPVAWRFAHERLGEQLLLREMLASIAPRTVPSGEEIVAWAKTAAGSEHEAPFGMLQSALDRWVEQLIAKGETSFVGRLLDIEDRTLRARLIATVLQALQNHESDEDVVSQHARLLAALGHAGMLRNRAPRLLAASWLPLSRLCKTPASSLGRATHRSIFDVARSAYDGRTSQDDRLAYGSSLLALADAARANEDFEDAHRYLAEAIQLLTDAAAHKGADERMRSVLAAAHWGIAKIEHRQTRLRRARKALDTALKVSSLTDDERQPLPAGQHQERLLSLLLMGDVLSAEGAPQEAAQAYEEALRASLAALAEMPFRSDLRYHHANALIGLAQVAIDSDQPDVVRERFRSALGVLRKLIRREPQRPSYHLALIDTLHRLAKVHRLAAENHEACQLGEEAAAIMLALVQAFPKQQDWQTQLVVMLARLGVLMRQIGEDEPARACLQDALRFGRLLPDDETAQHATVSALLSLLQLDEAQGRRFEGRKHAKEALSLLNAMARGPERLAERRTLAMGLLAQSRQMAEDGDPQSAGVLLHRAVNILSELLVNHPDDMMLQTDLHVVINHLRYLGASGSVRRIPKHRFSVRVMEHQGAEIREFFDQDTITIGRAPGNDLMIPDYSVSRQHAQVHFADGSFTVHDLGSKLGTVVSGKRVSDTLSFQPGERLELGDFELVFEGPIDASYRTQYSSLMAESPTGYPPPVMEGMELASGLLEAPALSQEEVRELNDLDVIDEE
ncbi:MAG TPA: FHA domain-containing protein [Polyangiaceae bacterium]|jgi:tetratricopeptide (TPR) repeat protein|nr:MAG: Oxoglutarate dehydrogenase inhibitor [Deltaproteobacteria bacterium ADurb.Bin207]HNS98247.1 FHA domain-containing protein [Polyangiaceae bacterium]HNZ25387.1 FHA domain-containing protein [Polyangiaceae bacterium]HOD24906.1 FHA domain-containing protein [Polyangiaceae bacterium]HOE51098.1 FHA domain-containing protein [Polyangiaceae bacterium]